MIRELIHELGPWKTLAGGAGVAVFMFAGYVALWVLGGMG